MKQSLRVLCSLIVVLTLASLTSCAVFSRSYQPDSHAQELADTLRQQGALVTEENYIRLNPSDQPETNQGSPRAIIFYPGAKVEPLSYLPLWDRMRNQGFTVFIVDMPLNFAFLNIGAAGKIMEDHPEFKGWVIAGHSLGGAMAAEHLKKFWGDCEALVLIGSYPGSSTDLSAMTIPVLSIREEFGLPGSQEKADAVRGNLPSHTRFEILAGANHAQYGNYGIQRDDGEPRISREEQQKRTAELMIEFLSGTLLFDTHTNA